MPYSKCGPMDICRQCWTTLTIQIMKLAWVTYLGALLGVNAILIPQISAHPPILHAWALFREGTVCAKHPVTASIWKYPTILYVDELMGKLCQMALRKKKNRLRTK